MAALVATNSSASSRSSGHGARSLLRSVDNSTPSTRICNRRKLPKPHGRIGRRTDHHLSEKRSKVSSSLTFTGFSSA